MVKWDQDFGSSPQHLVKSTIRPPSFDWRVQQQLEIGRLISSFQKSDPSPAETTPKVAFTTVLFVHIKR
jgi:hypothetical protein